MKWCVLPVMAIMLSGCVVHTSHYVPPRTHYYHSPPVYVPRHRYVPPPVVVVPRYQYVPPPRTYYYNAPRPNYYHPRRY